MTDRSTAPRRRRGAARRGLTVAAAGLVAGLAGALAVAAPAAAHVTVNPSQATAGGYARLAFRVPTESDTASTTKLELYLPTDRPIATVSVMPVPGWTAAPHRKKLDRPVHTDDGDVTETVDQITWTASAGAEIKPGEFQEFPVSLGPLPSPGKLVFKALQYYSDGNVVRWIETPAGGSQPEHPAPVLTLVGPGSGAAAGSGDGMGMGGATAGANGGSAGTGSASTAFRLAVVGLVAGLIGLVLGGLALVRTRRTTN